MSGAVSEDHVGQLVMARLLTAGVTGASLGDFKKALEPIVGHRWAGSGLSARVEEALGTLESAGRIFRVRKGKSDRSTLTDAGRRDALGFLGIDRLPPKTTWDKLKKTYIAARALGLPAPEGEAAKRFGGDPGFRAALVSARYGLPLDDYPRKLEEALDALAWTLLGFAPGRKFDAKGVQAALFRRALGEAPDTGPKPDPKKEAVKLLAKGLGARQSGKDELRLAAIRRWVDDEAVAAETPRPEAVADEANAIAPPPLDLGRFAERVLDAARASTSGRFGENKVFIVHVWRALLDDPAIARLGIDGFKHRLAEANNARLLDLSRADLVEAMDAEDVRLSEVPYLGATFHFVRV